MTKTYKQFLKAEKKLNPKFPSDLFIEIKDDLDFLDRLDYLEKTKIIEPCFDRLERFYHMYLERSEEMREFKDCSQANIIVNSPTIALTIHSVASKRHIK